MIRTTPTAAAHLAALVVVALLTPGAARAVEVYGAIGEKYQKLGGARGVMGVAKTDELPAAGGGRFNQFEWGYIFWRGDLGAHNVLHPVSLKWQALGREGGFGYPISDSIRTARGWCNDFERGGTICFARKTGNAHATYGAIRAHWAQLGRERGRCGYPTSDEFPIAGGRRSNFEFGFISWTPRGGPVAHCAASFGNDVQLNPVQE